MELKLRNRFRVPRIFGPFNRTAYGIETGLDFTYFIASLLLIAPLMELKPFTYRVT